MAQVTLGRRAQKNTLDMATVTIHPTVNEIQWETGLVMVKLIAALGK
jgi:hypothetical protein